MRKDSNKKIMGCNFPGSNFPVGQFSEGNFPGGIFPRTLTGKKNLAGKSKYTR